LARRLLLLNGIAITGVILFHATGFGFTAMFFWPHQYRPVASPNFEAAGTAAYYGLRVMEQFAASFCVPAFLFVAGFSVSVLTGRQRPTVHLSALRARMTHLLGPYLFWSAVVLIGFALEGRVFSVSRYVRLLLTGGTNPNYYFVPMLIQLYLATPIIVRLAKRNWKALLWTTGLLQVFVYAIQYPLVVAPEAPGVALLAAISPKWLFLVHVFWFVFGVVAGFQQETFKRALERFRSFLIPATAVLFVLGIVEWELLLQWSGQPWAENRPTIIDGLYTCGLILCIVGYSDVRLRVSNTLATLGGKSYGIYLVHGLVMEYLSRGLYHLAPWVLGQQILFQPMLIVLGLSVPLIMMSVFRRSPSRAFYAQVFG
jgi:surface polysaccharide O-acyltransferase-like enzyme